MRVVVTGATGNVGTSVLEALGRSSAVTSILGIARRLPELRLPKVEWASADVRTADLAAHFAGAAAVVHLAWLIQPSRDVAELRSTNADGSRRVFDAVGVAGVPALVYASSVGAYSPGPKDRRVDESWPTGGVETSVYSRHKSEVERLLDGFEAERPSVRVVRLRKALVFKREASSEIRRLFLGPFFPSPLLRPALVPVVPDAERLLFQAVHSKDAGEAYRLAVERPVRGAFNVAAEPVIDAAVLARVFGARSIRVPVSWMRAGALLAWRLRLQPTPPGWLDLALGVPLMDATRARTELGWRPRWTAEEALREVVDGIRDGAGIATPPLSPTAGGRFRLREIASGVGAR